MKKTRPPVTFNIYIVFQRNIDYYDGSVSDEIDMSYFKYTLPLLQCMKYIVLQSNIEKL